jgi:hypothetical protein
MIATAVGFAFSPNRKFYRALRGRPAWLCRWAALLFLASSPLRSTAQQPEPTQPVPPAATPTTSAPADSSNPRNPIAIVPIEAANRDQAQVTGALQITKGTAFILSSGTITSGSMTTNVVLPKRGVLRVCASTAVHLSSDASVPAGETPGLMMALDHGAVETSFATGRNSDVLLTPDFRILIGSPGSSEVKVRLGQHGDTCVDNPGANAPYVVVSSVFEGGAYRVQPGQRVMFQHGSLKEVVDHEKEPCGCPPEARPGTNEFPLAQSAGLAPLEKPAPPPQPAATSPATQPQPAPQLNEPLVYTAPPPAQEQAPQPPPAAATPAVPPQTAPPSAPVPAKKKPGLFRSIGRFFKKVFGAE